MAIAINNGEVRPALTYDRLHIVNFNLQIEKVAHNPKKRIDIVAVAYALDADGGRVFSDKQLSVSTGDFDTDVMKYALTTGANASMEEALLEYQAQLTAVAGGLAAGTLSVWHLMAEFEAALGKIFDITGVADFDTVN